MALGLAKLVVLPRVAVFHCSSWLLGRHAALEGATQALARVPGLRGQYVRRAFLPFAGVACHQSATVCFGTVFSKAGAILEENVYVGPRCHLGLVHLERDVLVAAGVHIPSGGRTHGTNDVERTIRNQVGATRLVRIGAGSWIGSSAVVMADVGKNSVVGAGSVVTRPIPDNVVAAGVPARVIRQRH